MSALACSGVGQVGGERLASGFLGQDLHGALVGDLACRPVTPGLRESRTHAVTWVAVVFIVPTTIFPAHLHIIGVQPHATT